MAALSAGRGQSTVRALFSALGESRLLVPIRGTSEEGAELAIVQEAEGRPAVHAFTDEATLGAVLAPDTRYVVVAAPKLAATVLAIPEATLVIDPGSPEGGRLSPQDLELVRERLSPGREDSAAVPADDSLRVLDRVDSLPDALLTALREAAAGILGVLALYVFEGALGEGERHPFVGARLDPFGPESEHRRTLAALSEAARTALPAETKLDLISLTPGMLEPVAATGELVWERVGNS